MKNRQVLSLGAVAWISLSVTTTAEAPWSTRMADSVMALHPDPLLLDSDQPKWEYTHGLLLDAVLRVWQRTGEEKYLKYVDAYYDSMIDAQGRIRTYSLDEFNIDRINPGKALLVLYEKTGKQKYRKALDVLREQLRKQPRTTEGGFWHKERYPSQMWLDGLYMGAPFLARYAKAFGEPAAFDDVATQFVLMEKHARDDATGLLYHGWDESRKQRWADPKTGCSPSFWGRSMGWYAMGLVEALDSIPLDDPRRGELLAILGRLSAAITKAEDPGTGVWYQVLDQGTREGNYLEASASCMFTFALLRASRLGYIDAKYAEVGRRAYQGILRQFVEVGKSGLVSIQHVCQVAGLGGDPSSGRYRDGTFEYYVTEKILSDDPKAVGPFIFASLEMEAGR
jgi:unsaturated rhamnogalacturonyl hydrolase